MKSNINRFPLTLMASLITGIYMVYLNEYSSYVKELNFILRTLYLGVILSLVIEIFLETKKLKKEGKILIGLMEIGVLFLYYKFSARKESYPELIRYFGIIMFLVISMFFVGRLKNREKYELYVIDIIKSSFVAFISSLILFLGIAFIITTINILFSIEISITLISNIGIIIFSVFFTSLFTSKIPEVGEKYGEEKISLVFEKILANILIPLIFTYSLILYLFFIKTLVIRQWPHGKVAHLVLWYSLVGVFSLFFTKTIREENKLAKSFRSFHPILNIPTIFLLFISLFIRVKAYGFTINRYLVLLGGIYILLLDIYYVVKKDEENILASILLGFLTLIFSFGPLSGTNITIKSQANRLKKILVENSLLKDGKLVKNKNMGKKEIEEINNKLTYLDRFGFDNIAYLPDDFSTENSYNYLGFPYSPYMEYIEETKYYDYTRPQEEGLDIGGYRQVFKLDNDRWDMEINFENLELVQSKRNIFEIKVDGKVKRLDIGELLKDNDKIKNAIEDEDIVYEFEFEGYKFKLIFQELSGDIKNYGFALYRFSAYLLIS